MTQEEIHRQLAGRFPDAELTPLGGRVPATLVPADLIYDVCFHLRDEATLAFDYPASITAVDYLDYFEVIYQVRSMKHAHDATLKVRVDRDGATIPSVFGVWPGADFQEREIYDLMGVEFSGHPNLQRILLWDEFVGHPLRKDYGIPAPMPPEVELALSQSGVAEANVIGTVVPGPRNLDP